MKNDRMIKFVSAAVAVTALLPFVCSCSAKQEEEPGKEYTGTIEQQINEFYEDHSDTAAGMQMAVFDNEGVIYKGYFGYSNIEEQIPMDEDTVVDWGSTTKTMVWVSVMQLWEQGRIDLEADVRTYLPDGFLTNLRYDKPVRMIDLMNHRAGFQEYYTDMFQQPEGDYLSLEEALQLDQPPQIFEPDTMTAYSNWGVALAGYIVERVSGMSFCDYVHQNILEPLGMNDTALAPDLMDDPDVRARRDELVCYSGTTPLGSAFYYIQLYPAGACVSTLDDYVRFASCFVADECPLFEDQATFDYMMTATSYFGDTGIVKNCHGFWALPFGENVRGHGGNTQACSSYIVFDPDAKLGAVVMTNQAAETVFNGPMLDLIFGGYAWGDEPVPSGIPSQMLHPARTMLEGKFRIMGVSYVSSDTFEEWMWTYNEKDGIAKIEFPYGDYYFVPTAQVAGDCIIVYGWAVGLLFSGISIFVKFIRGFVGLLIKKRKKITTGWWSLVTSILQLSMLVPFLFILISFSLWFNHTVYAWTFPAMVVLGVLIFAMAVWGVADLISKRGELTVKRKIYNIAVILFSLLTVVFILFCQII